MCDLWHNSNRINKSFLSLFTTVQSFSKTGSHEVFPLYPSSSDCYGVIDRLEPDLAWLRRIMLIYYHLEQIIRPCSRTLQHCDSVKPPDCFPFWWKHQISFQQLETLLSKWHHQTSKYRFQTFKTSKIRFQQTWLWHHRVQTLLLLWFPSTSLDKIQAWISFFFTKEFRFLFCL